MHLKRLLIALILLPLLFFYITRLHARYFVFLLAAAAAVAQHEFYSMYDVKGLLRYSGIAFGILMLCAAYLSADVPADLLFISFLSIACIRLFSRHDPASSLKDISSALAAVVYIPGLLIYQVYLRKHGAEWIIFLYGCVWASDSTAYYVGSSIGRRKLYEKISPKKTVAGAVGSLAGGAAGAIILKSAFIYDLPLIKAAIAGMIIGVTAVAGDLVESMFKRDAGVKDSSSLIPGHGGLLDKLDSALFAGPVFYWMAKGLGLMA